MILVDANLLLYAKVADFPQHEPALAWLDGELERPTRVGLPWESLSAFVRLVTNPRVFARPLDVRAAMAQVEDWLSRPAAWVPQPTAEHASILEDLLSASRGAAELVADAHLGAIAVGHGLTVMSNDADFGRFDGVRWENPVA